MPNPVIETKKIPTKVNKYDDDIKADYIMVYDRVYRMFGSNMIAEKISDIVVSTKYNGRLNTNKKSKNSKSNESRDSDPNPVEGTPYTPPSNGRGDLPSV